jgi:hypothetical protein
MALVVKVLPLKVPPQVPPTEKIVYPEFGVSVNERVLPETTPVMLPDGLMVPPVPLTLAVMV